MGCTSSNEVDSVEHPHITINGMFPIEWIKHVTLCGRADNKRTDKTIKNASDSNSSAFSSNFYSYNEIEIDISHFVTDSDGIVNDGSGRALGLGGFGMVRRIRKISGADCGTHYAIKSMSKSMIIKRNSGVVSVMNELKALIMLSGCKYVCNIQYAFQDSR